MKPDILRSLYLNFFAKNHHAVVPSSALVPENDPTTLFTGSGMQPMMEYLLGAKHPKGKRVTDSQKCFRSQDIEEVGDNRHTTFFEMLGNWSFGDYFKQEQLTWFFNFLIKEVGLDPNKLFVTVFRGNDSLGIPKDTESVKIWQKLFNEVGIEAKVVDDSIENGLQAGRIFYYDETKNWWSRAGVPSSMPVGEPGGPDSEVFYDFGADKQIHEHSKYKDQKCHVNCDCGRFLEIGNNVFMEYQKQADGDFKPLKQRNVDFGGGLERILAVKENTDDVFKTQLFTPIISFLENLSGHSYDESEKIKRSFRVIADHMKASVMLAGDGVYPVNKEQGYFARRLVRRAVRYAKMIGINSVFINDIVAVIIQVYKNAYPELKKLEPTITKVLANEEHKFMKTLQKGLRELEKQQKLDGKIAFKLYETYGFPFELTQEIAQERGQDIDEDEYLKAKKEHAQQSRSNSVEKFKGGLQDSSEQTKKYHTATHLLHSALRKILGTHVQQKGSNITNKRLRFDFSHNQALTLAQKQQVEDQVNEWIEQGLEITVQQMTKEKALNEGAVAFFIDKYPDEVTVYTIGDKNNYVSKELCGGPHVKNTREIGRVKLFKEKAVGGGIRRVYIK